MAAFLLVGIGLAIWGAIETRNVVAAARDARAAQADLEERLESRDWAGARTAGDRLRVAADDASAAAHALPLDIAAWLPMVGDDVEAAQVLTGGLDRISKDALDPLLQSLEGADSLSTGGGTVDVALLADLGAVMAPADETISDVAADVAALDTDALLGPLREPVEEARDGLAELADRSHDVSGLVQHLPGFLGADGPRQYLLVLQNPAEARPTGGIVGTFALVRAEGGQLTLVETVGNDALLQLDRAGLDAVPEAVALFGEQLSHVANLTMSPDFPQAAQLLSHLWQQSGQPAPDGVIALDPVALQQVLGVTGAVAVPGGPEVNADNAVDLLMHNAYDLLGGLSDARDDYLKNVVGAVFTAATQPGTDLWGLGQALALPEVRGHVTVWSGREDEQAFLRDVAYAGELGDPADRVGVYVTNADASKLDYFLDAAIAATCTGDGSTVSLTLTNSVPAEVSHYIGSKLTTPNTTHRVTVSWYVPRGRGVGSLTVDGGAASFVTGDEGDWLVLRREVDIPAGGSVRIDLSIPGSTPLADVMTQPFVRAPQVDLSGCR